MSYFIWKKCLIYLQSELPDTEFSTWIRPLQVELIANVLSIYAPNRFVLDWVRSKYLNRINYFLNNFCDRDSVPVLRFEVGRKPLRINAIGMTDMCKENQSSVFSSMKECSKFLVWNHSLSQSELSYRSNINPKHNFNNFLEGKCNQLARAAAQKISDHVGGAYNPLFLYGGTGVGKTHLLHAMGNDIMMKSTSTRVVYMSSEKFVQDMVRALQSNSIEKFKLYYRSVDVLLIDDIQFFANKGHSQEEFFYTLNSLLEGNQQIVLTSDRYPKKIEGVTDKLKSRFGWGLTVGIEAPELEICVRILMKRAEESKIFFPYDVALFIAQRLHSNIRELEGAFNCVVASSNFTGRSITIDFVRESLKDLLAFQKRFVSIHNIQKIVSEYYNIKLMDLLSKRRSRSLVRPRQIAIALSKEFSDNSLSEIGNAFGGRDRTTVLYSYKKINRLRDENHDVKEDFFNLTSILFS